MRKIAFILFLLIANSSISQEIAWSDSENILIIDFTSGDWRPYSNVLYYHDDSIRELGILGVYVDEKIESLELITLDQFLANLPENLAKCAPCIVMDGEIYVEVFNLEREPEENDSVISVNIQFTNGQDMKIWEVSKSMEFANTTFEYKDYHFRKY